MEFYYRVFMQHKKHETEEQEVITVLMAVLYLHSWEFKETEIKLKMMTFLLTTYIILLLIDLFINLFICFTPILLFEEIRTKDIELCGN